MPFKFFMLLIKIVSVAGLLTFASISFAASIFNEGFEGTTGNEITTLGWTKTADATSVVSTTLLDSGKSAKKTTGYSTCTYQKSLSPSYTISTTETLTVTATISVPNYSYVSVFVRDAIGNRWGLGIYKNSPWGHEE
jgi:hypothetical protein